MVCQGGAGTAITVRALVERSCCVVQRTRSAPASYRAVPVRTRGGSAQWQCEVRRGARRRGRGHSVRAASVSDAAVWVVRPVCVHGDNPAPHKRPVLVLGPRFTRIFASGVGVVQHPLHVKAAGSPQQALAFVVFRAHPLRARHSQEFRSAAITSLLTFRGVI